MEQTPDFVEQLERDFEASLVHELLPGILHNFANPLNGIMGRSKLLQKRAGQAFGSIKGADTSPPVTDKILRDIDLISEQGDRLFELFSHVSAKVRRLHEKQQGLVNLSEILSEEIAFFDFYLDFKHSVEKNINLNMNVPTMMAVPADYSLAFSSIIRHAMNAMSDSDVRVLSVYSDYDDRFVHIAISYSGSHAQSLPVFLHDDGACGEPLNANRGFFNALRLLKKYDVEVSCETTAGVVKIQLSIPRGQ